MAKAKHTPQRPTLFLPPFPQLSLDDVVGSLWEGTDVLPAFKGYQSRGGAYASRSRSKSSTGQVRLTVPPPEERGGPTFPPAPDQLRAYRFLKDNQQAIADAILKMIFRSYPKFRETYGTDPEEGGMPVVKTAEQLKNFVGPSTIHVLPVSKSGVTYVGFEFGCDWDEEHGLGVMTHKKRVVEVGGADTSFLEWIATRDGGKMIKP
jgi:hypothetical protein